VTNRISLIGLVLITLLTLADIIHDLSSGLPLDHIFHEIALLFISLGILYFQFSLVKKKEREIKMIQQRFQDLTGGFHKTIDEQLQKWQLTPSEKDIALLLIKGMSMKEIATARQAQETTIRQQATSIYKKSGLLGRQQLAAFFLEDIFPS
jgi:DNA-binding CsgD family transcriptional regulator